VILAPPVLLPLITLLMQLHHAQPVVVILLHYILTKLVNAPLPVSTIPLVLPIAKHALLVIIFIKVNVLLAQPVLLLVLPPQFTQNALKDTNLLALLAQLVVPVLKTVLLPVLEQLPLF